MSSEPATAIEPAWLCSLLQISDSFYPTGSYAHSYGLEGLVQEGLVHDRASLGAYLRQSLVPALRQVELPLAAHAWRALGEPPDWELVADLAERAHVLKSPREARLASENIGRQRIELVQALRPHPLAAEFLRRQQAAGWPFCASVAAAVEGRVAGAPLEAVLAGLAYAVVAGVVAASMKLLRLGQQAAQTLLVEMLGEMPTAITRAQQIPLAEIGWFNPWLDIAAARHETSDFRLFIS